MPSATSAASVPAKCQPGDSGETSPLQLQGQVPVADRISGRAASGYQCNLKLIGGFSDFPIPIDLTHNETAGWATLDSYKNCAYYGQAAGAGWTVVMDVTDPTHPKETAKLSTPAMQNPWESMRVNQKRGLLVADHNAAASLDIYDVSQDCAHPKLIRSLGMPSAIGHEGWFQPDGMVYYMSCLCASGVWPIDLSDPYNPKEMAHFADVGSIHGGSESADGTRGYFCQTGSPDALLIVDTSDIALRRPNPKDRIISSLPYPDNSACQATYPLMYGNHLYVVQYGESTPAPVNPFTGQPNPAAHRNCQPGGITTFSAPRLVDAADEKHPKTASNLLLQVDDPANCQQVQADISARSVSFFPNVGGGGALFEYDVHHCSPDRLQDPTILACATFLSGLRVWDIRDPKNPHEVAYYSMGTIAATDQTVDDTISRPVIWTDRGLILFTSEFTGFHVARFEGGVLPLATGAACPSAPDYYFGQYNPNTTCTYPAASAAVQPTLPNTPAGGSGALMTFLVLGLTAGCALTVGRVLRDRAR